MRTGFVVIVLLQALLLLSLIGYRHYWVEHGRRILLKTEPVDPRDIFRGDYVRLGYDISGLDLGRLGVSGDFKRNERVYVRLGPQADGTCQPLGISRSEPGENLFIQGRVLSLSPESRWEVDIRDERGTTRTLRPTWFTWKKGERLVFCLNRNGDVMSQSKAESPGTCWNREWQRLTGVVVEAREEKIRQLRVEYGIESYFVEEGKGTAIEAARTACDLKVEVSLRRDGKGIIIGLLLDGKPVR